MFYRVRNALGALVVAQRAFAVVENEDAGDHALEDLDRVAGEEIIWFRLRERIVSFGIEVRGWV